jgi:chromosome segregation ATPase
MTSQKEQQQQKATVTTITTNPNPTYKSLSDLENANADLEQARIQINSLIEERNSMSATIGRLDRDVAKLKDRIGELEQQQDGVLPQFQDLYNKHEGLLEVVAQNLFASNISTGRLAEALARFKFIIPEARQQ